MTTLVKFGNRLSRTERKRLDSIDIAHCLSDIEREKEELEKELLAFQNSILDYYDFEDEYHLGIQGLNKEQGSFFDEYDDYYFIRNTYDPEFLEYWDR